MHVLLAKRILALKLYPSQNAVNLIVRKEFWHIRRLHVKNFAVYGECAKRILPYMEDTRGVSFFFADLSGTYRSRIRI
jgi:hypothetical protein